MSWKREQDEVGEDEWKNMNVWHDLVSFTLS